jgi:hypothetical protein
MDAEVRLHPHARERMIERGASLDEVIATVREGERFPARFDRTGFRRTFAFEGIWRGRRYSAKQVDLFAVEEGGGWLVVTVIVRYF